MNIFDPDDSRERRYAKAAFIVAALLVYGSSMYSLHLFMKWWTDAYWEPFVLTLPFWIKATGGTAFMVITAWFLWWSNRRYR